MKNELKQNESLDFKIKSRDESIRARRSIKKIEVWILILSLLAAHFIFRSVIYADIETRSVPISLFHTENETCSIDFPSQPTLIQKSLHVSEGKKLNYDIYLAPFEEKKMFMLLIATYPLPVSGGHEVSGLEGLLQGIVEHHPENRLIFAEFVESFEQPAIDFLVENATSYFRGHALMSGNKLYLIAIEGGKADSDESTFHHFLKSFKLFSLKNLK